MIAAATLRRRFDRPVALRMLAAGATWGLVLSAGFAAMAAWACEPICLDGVAAMTATNIAVGIATIGPLAAIVSRR